MTDRTASEDPWFKPKTHGFGATPANWKGWMATFGFIGICVLWAQATILGEARTNTDIAIFLVGLTGLCLAFSLFCKMKTDGAWTWRWGKRDQGSK